MKPTIVAVIGSRTRTKSDGEAVRRLVGPIIKGLDPNTVVVSGGCTSGADYWCKHFCNLYNRKYLEAVAFWHPASDIFSKSVDKSAGHRRNRTIVEVCDRLIAVWDGKSPGTGKTIEYAHSVGCPVEVVQL